ncbi:threonine/serine dehydratase [Anaerotignum faecicola]|nr:threonine/serine dehydratase [Anaerotignum faecicola]
MQVKDITSRDIWRAKQRISPYITRTPLVYSPALSEMTGANIYIKMENLQAIGAFKVRGAANKILGLSESQKEKGVSTFSTGNHGMAVAYIADRLNVKATVCMSKNVPDVKVKAISRYNPTILQNWDSQDAAGVYCYELQEKEGVTVIPPFDDKEIICGQGTMSLEILEDCPEIDTAIVPLSGGGLISGVTLGFKLTVPGVKVIGVSQERAAVMIESLKAGRPVEMPEEPTLADSLLGGIGLDNKYTFDIVRDYVDETVQVGEEEISKGIAYIMENHHVIAEGASATGIAYALRSGAIKKGSNVAIIVTGNGISMETVKQIVNDNY